MGGAGRTGGKLHRRVIDERLGVFHDLLTTAATQYTHTGLTPGIVT